MLCAAACRGNRVEKARLYKASNEGCFGVQIATNVIAEAVAAAALAKEAGATWIDINCGCPIHEATKRGLGAVMLRKPTKLAKMVHGIVQQVDLPVTVKIRTGESEKKINANYVVSLLQAAGAAAVSIHGRTMEQRYKKAADWHVISQVASSHTVPVIGNGDILTHYEARDRQQQYNCHALMVGRGALIKPWIFHEYKQGYELQLTTKDRVGVYRQLASYMKEHFGDDAMGKRKSFYFLPWHFSFFHRYRHFPQQHYLQASRTHPLIATRTSLVDPLLGELENTLPAVERLLRCEHETAHQHIADFMWESSSDDEAMLQLDRLAADHLTEWELQVKAGDGRDAVADATAEG
eukprot:jgi/Chrzof1/3369/Cz12g22180.t1